MFESPLLRSTPFWYRALLALILPLYRLRVFLRSRHESDYQREVWQRFGPLPAPIVRRPVWVHAVSVGETNAAEPIIRHLLDKGLPVLVTNTTRTGAARVRTLFSEAMARRQLAQHFLPVDTVHLMHDMVSLYQPCAMLMIETEIWPNLLSELHHRGIPSLLMNARLSARSAKGYGKFPGLMTPMMQHLAMIAAQDQATAERFIGLGADPDKVVVTGSLKFDLNPPEHLLQLADELKAEWHLDDRPVIVAVSTHEPEEAELLVQFKRLRESAPNALLILVPRHPERFERVAGLIREQGFVWSRRSELGSVLPDTAVFLADSMGEAWAWYALAKVAFVGGSLSETGGHNPLEPARLGVPVVMGPHTFNFAKIVEQLIEAGALVQVADADAVEHVWLNLLTDEGAHATASEAAQQVMQANQGALQRQLDLLDQVIGRGCAR